MLATLYDRGPDSAGFAVYGSGTPGAIKLTLRAPKDFDLTRIMRDIVGLVAERHGVGAEASA